MSLRFFVDHCIPVSLIHALQKEGHQVFSLKNYLPIHAPDMMVVMKTQELEAILISLNGDFADIVTYPPKNYKGIVALQLRNQPQLLPKLFEQFKKYLSLHNTMAHYAGKLFVIEINRIRVWES